MADYEHRKLRRDFLQSPERELKDICFFGFFLQVKEFNFSKEVGEQGTWEKNKLMYR